MTWTRGHWGHPARRLCSTAPPWRKRYSREFLLRAVKSAVGAAGPKTDGDAADLHNNSVRVWVAVHGLCRYLHAWRPVVSPVACICVCTVSEQIDVAWCTSVSLHVSVGAERRSSEATGSSRVRARLMSRKQEEVR